MTARGTAIKDIKDDLMQESKSFLAFRKRLDPIMEKMVSDYIEMQEDIDHGKA